MVDNNTGKTAVTTTSRAFKGFSSRADNNNYKLYDFQLLKQNLINRLSIRKGERLENPDFGTIIYDVLFEPLTDDLKQAILDDITANVNADPRLSSDNITVSQSDYGISVQVDLTYKPYNITEKLIFGFDENSSLGLS